MAIKYLTVHCSDSPNNREVAAAEIHRWHQEKKFDGIGYHAVIRRDGTIEKGRPLYWHGAHVRRYNRVSLGVCLIGKDEFTDEQLRSLELLLQEWLDLYPSAKVVGHRDLDPKKTCPNFDVSAWCKETGIINA